MKKTLEEARAMIASGQAGLVIIKDGSVAHTANGRGVLALLGLYRENPQILENACVADKITGKAAAMILALGGAAEVYGEVMSKHAFEYLMRRGIPARFTILVEAIAARDGKGVCPVEKSVLDLDDPAEGLQRITETIAAIIPTTN